MMMVQTGVASLVRARPDANPKDVFSTLNRVVYENVHDRLEAERHMTLSLMRVAPTGAIRIAGAHMDAVVWRAATQTCELLATPGTFLAISDDIEAVNVERDWQLERGDLMILLTDGVTEAENQDGVPFGYERVIEVVEPRASKPVTTVRDALFEALVAHSPVLADDATILVLRYVGREEAA
jgi:sigma-B regulation protein RsbU (phosphoserine phosphatase)